MSNVNIRSKPTKMPENDDEEYVAPSPQLIQEDLKAAVVQMDSIDTVPSNKFKVKDSPIRSPAPMPEAISPAGIPIDLGTGNDIEKRGEFKIDFGDEVDMTIAGKRPEEYKRNVEGSLMVLALLFVSIILFTVHVTMFSMVVDFDSPALIMAAILYYISTICILALLLSALIIPSFSIDPDKFSIYYSPILVAGGIDFVAVCMGGGVFGPLVSSYSRDPMVYEEFTAWPAVWAIVINGALYYAFAKTTPNTLLFSYFHSFERLNTKSVEDESVQEQEQERDQNVDHV